MRWLVIAAAALLLGADEGYHDLPWDRVPTEACASTPTHVSVTGYAQWTRKEADGDVHVRFCERRVDDPGGAGRCLVAEIIPAIPIARPSAGRRAKEIEIRGIARWDSAGGHGWFEIHPVLGWQEIGR